MDLVDLMYKYINKFINSDELLSTLSGGNTWLPLNIVFGLEGNLFSASSDVAYAAGFAGISLGGGSKISSFLSIGYTYMSSYDFLPAVVLDKKVKLVNNTSCASGAILGSKECPYKLECSSCA